MARTVRETRQERIDKWAQEGHACVCFNLRRAARAITRLYDEGMRRTDLRVTQLSILGVTMALGPVTVTRLAEATGTDRTTLTRNLNVLRKQGLLRVETGGDRRERVVTLTDRGREALANAYPIWKEAQARVVNSFGRERLKRLLSELAAVVAVTRRG